MTATWTTGNIQRLLASLRNNIPADEISSAYSKGLKAIDWDKVAFDPFSPSRCRRKWEAIMHKVQKIRTLAEVINVAEDTICNPVEKNGCKKILPDPPKKPSQNKKNDSRGKIPRTQTSRTKRGGDEDGMPASNGFILFCKERQKSSPADSGKKKGYTLLKMWEALTEEQREEYRCRCIRLWKEQADRCDECLEGTKSKKSKVGRFKGEPARPPRTGYSTFFQEQMKLHKGNHSNRKEHFGYVSKKWADLPDRKKKAYKQRAQQNKIKYSDELLKWFEKLTPAVQEDFLKCNPEKKKCLEAQQTQVHDGEDQPWYRPLDSEDEDIESNSSSDISDYLECEELEGDGQGDVFEFF